MERNGSFAEYAGRKATKPDHVLARDLSGEAVILNIENAQYYGLDDVGTRIYNVLTTSETVQAAFETVLREYDVAAETLQHDMLHLIDEMVEHGLLVLDE